MKNLRAIKGRTDAIPTDCNDELNGSSCSLHQLDYGFEMKIYKRHRSVLNLLINKANCGFRLDTSSIGGLQIHFSERVERFSPFVVEHDRMLRTFSGVPSGKSAATQLQHMLR